MVWQLLSFFDRKEKKNMTVCSFHASPTLLELASARKWKNDASDTSRAVFSARLLDEVSAKSRHTWIRRCRNVFDPGEMQAFLLESGSVTGICTSLDQIFTLETARESEINDLLSRLFDHVTAVDRALPLNRNGVSMGFLIEVMIPSEMDEYSQMRDTAYQVLKALGYRDNALFFVREYNRGDQGCYIGIFVSPRTILSEETDVVVSRAQKDRYRSSRTGRMCSADDPDAVIAVRKGEPLKCIRSVFSETTDFMDLSPKNFRRVMTEAKLMLKDLFVLLGYGWEEKVLLGEYYAGRNWSSYSRKVIWGYNRAFRKTEDELNDVYGLVLHMGVEARLEFRRLVSRLRRMQWDVKTEKEDILRPSDILVRFDCPMIVAKKAIGLLHARMQNELIMFENRFGIVLQY